MREYRFTLAIPREEFLAYYEGQVHAVVATTWGGTRIRFPARYLRPFVEHRGVYGQFVLITDERNKFVGLHRLR